MGRNFGAVLVNGIPLTLPHQGFIIAYGGLKGL